MDTKCNENKHQNEDEKDKWKDKMSEIREVNIDCVGCGPNSTHSEAPSGDDHESQYLNLIMKIAELTIKLSLCPKTTVTQLITNLKKELKMPITSVKIAELNHVISKADGDKTVVDAGIRNGQSLHMILEEEAQVAPETTMGFVNDMNSRGGPPSMNCNLQ